MQCIIPYLKPYFNPFLTLKDTLFIPLLPLFIPYILPFYIPYFYLNFIVLPYFYPHLLPYMQPHYNSTKVAIYLLSYTSTAFSYFRFIKPGLLGYFLSFPMSTVCQDKICICNLDALLHYAL